MFMSLQVINRRSPQASAVSLRAGKFMQAAKLLESLRLAKNLRDLFSQLAAGKS